jgi:hypothetical protein
MTSVTAKIVGWISDSASTVDLVDAPTGLSTLRNCSTTDGGRRIGRRPSNHSPIVVFATIDPTVKSLKKQPV